MEQYGEQLGLDFDLGFTGKSPCCERRIPIPESTVAFLLAMGGPRVICSCGLSSARAGDSRFTVSFDFGMTLVHFENANQAAEAFTAGIADGRCDCAHLAAWHAEHHEWLREPGNRMAALALGHQLGFVSGL